MTHASLFSGIGGPEVAAAMMGWDNVFHCEINPFGRSILDYWFPESESYEDITKTDFTKHRGQIDVLTGGFPCQPFSYAGKRGGQEDDRYLWPEMLRVIDQIRPTWVVGENVAGITTMVESGEVIDMGGETSLSKRITEFTDSDLITSSPSNASAETLSQRDIPSNRCLFRLALSELPIGETEYSLLLITPTVVMTCESPENMRARAERNGYQNGTQYGSLESQVMYDPRCIGFVKGKALRNCFQKTGGKNFRLSPLFTEEMMGFPSMWTTLPFLSQSGETNP